MSTKIFEKIACNGDIPDERVRGAFNLLVVETSMNNAIMISTLELLGRYRQKLSGEISREIISSVSKEQLEKAFDQFEKDAQWSDVVLANVSIDNLLPTKP